MTDILVMCRRMMFCEIIGHVFGGRSKEKLELFLGFPVFEPPIPHVHGFSTALFDGVVDETNCGGIVKGNWGRRLRETHFHQGESNGNGFFAVVESNSYFTISR